MEKKFNLKQRAATPPRAPSAGRAQGGAGGAGGAGGSKAGAKERPRKLYSAEDQLALLQTYIHVPKSYWAELKPGAHVRYYVKHRPDGQLSDGPDPEAFRVGGYIVANPYTWKPKNSPREKQGMLLSTSLRYRAGQKGGAPAWTAETAETRDVYVRSDPSALLVRMELARVVDQMNSNIIQLGEKVRQIDRRLQLLEGRSGGDARGRGDHREEDRHRHRSKSRHSRGSRHGD